MSEIFIHQRENSEDTERHLQSHQEKYQSDGNFLLGLLYKGHRLHARQIEREYNIDGRRLREIFHSRNDIRKEWVVENGKTRRMEYWMEFFKPLTKEQSIQWAEDYFRNLKQAELFQ